jgi:hypothetical protein
MMHDALHAIVIDQKISTWLEANNPKALLRARRSLIAFCGLEPESSPLRAVPPEPPAQQ